MHVITTEEPDDSICRDMMLRRRREMPLRSWSMLSWRMGWILRVSAMLFARNWPTTSWVRWPLPTPGPLHERWYRPVGPTRAQRRQQRQQQQQRHLRHAPVRTRLAIARQIGNIATVARPAVIITGIMSLPNSSLTSTGVVDTGPHRGCAEGAQRRQREV